MQEALKQAIRQSEQQQQICPECGSEQGHGEGTKRRVLLTCFGRVEVALRRVRCEHGIGLRIGAWQRSKGRM